MGWRRGRRQRRGRRRRRRRGRATVAAEVSALGGVVGGDDVGTAVVEAADPAAARRLAEVHPVAATGVLWRPSRCRPALVVRGTAGSGSLAQIQRVLKWGRGGLVSGRRVGGVHIASTLGMQVTFGGSRRRCYG
uniref:Uncharacterized protein n=1 Tax=Oryza barthii TaxID=65489 RepID=A0A0D3HV30_9ORYZ